MPLNMVLMILMCCSRMPKLWLEIQNGLKRRRLGQGVLSAINHSPFSRVKSVFADMDIAAARAKGYVKATEKEKYISKRPNV